MLRFQLRNTILTPATGISILGLYLFMVLSLYPNPTADVMYNYQYVISMGYGAMFIPVAVVLPICFYLHHVGTKQSQQFSLIRSRLSSYIRSTILTAVLSGMVVTLAAFLLFTLTCYLYSPEGTPYIGLGLYSAESDSGNFYARFFDHPVALYLLMGTIFTINGAMWPIISLFCFSFTTNQYVVVAVPFLLKTVIAYIAGMLNLYYLDPGQLKLFGCVSTELPGGGIPYALGYIGAVTLLCGGIWAIRMCREVRHA
jgi:hypothetical protein